VVQDDELTHPGVRRRGSTEEMPMRAFANRSRLVAIVACGVFVSHIAAPPIAGAQTTLTPVDVVSLKDGGMVRGTIGELKPGVSVEIVAIDGASRTFAMSAVRYAGPAAGMPVGGDPTHGEATLQLTTPQPDVRFHRLVGREQGSADGAYGTIQATTNRYEELCGAPCELKLPVGRHTLGLSSGDGDVIDAPPLDIPDGKSVVEGTYVSHAGRRIAAAIVGAAGMLAGLSIVLVGVVRSSHSCDAYGDCSDDLDPDVPTIVLGSGIFVGSLVVCLALVRSDEVHLHLRPLVTSLALPPGSRGRERLPAQGPSLALDW
jgi:hypothetical protein